MTRRPYTAFVRNVAHAATEAELRAALEHAIGGLTYVRLIVDREQAGKHKGYGFVSFEKRGYVRAALDDNGQITRRGKLLFIAKTRS
jgi:RNA recognition motif-containing protein